MSTLDPAAPALDVAEEPSPQERVVQKELNGRWFEARLYPGWVGQVEVNDQPLYVQAKDGPMPFDLPPGHTHPNPGGPFKFNRDSDPKTWWSINVNDPHHQIEYIVVYLKPQADGTQQQQADGPVALAGASTSDGEGDDSVTIYNTPVCCPPHCTAPVASVARRRRHQTRNPQG